MMKQRSSVIEELCKIGQLELFREIVAEAVELANKKDFQVTTRYDKSTSVAEWGTKLIRISLLEDATNKLKPLWDLLHEVGHVMDGYPDNVELSSQERISREENAWKNARVFIESHYHLLGKYSDDFNNYKNECLKNYHQMLKLNVYGK